jgi:hypothetical protein
VRLARTVTACTRRVKECGYEVMRVGDYEVMRVGGEVMRVGGFVAHSTYTAHKGSLSLT